MNNRKQPLRLLSVEGQKEVGHIFGEYVPVKQITPIEAELEGRNSKELVFLVDWQRLTEAQKAQVVEYMDKKFDAEPSEIREYIESMGYFAIRYEFVIESYSLRMFM